MNTRSFVLGSAIAGTLAVSALAAAPAEALQLSGSFRFGGPSTFYFQNATGSATQPNFTGVGDTLYLGFGNPTGSNGTGSFSFLGTPGSPNPGGVTLNRLPLTLASQAGSGERTFTASLPVNPFIDFGSRTIDGETGPLSFILDSGIFNGFISSAGQTVVGNNIGGRFVFGGETVGRGFLSASISGASSGYEMTLKAEPVPTPALLPGLLGMGMAALRKRRSEADEAVEA